jgi:hypothetical protein
MLCYAKALSMTLDLSVSWLVRVLPSNFLSFSACVAVNAHNGLAIIPQRPSSALSQRTNMSQAKLTPSLKLSLLQT